MIEHSFRQDIVCSRRVRMSPYNRGRDEEKSENL